MTNRRTAFFTVADSFWMMSVCICVWQSSREQLAIAEFANSLLVIPKQLTVNAAHDSTELVAKLRSFHNSSQTKPDMRELRWSVTNSLFYLDLFRFGFRESTM